MKRVVEEQLSAFLDDELPPEEMELLLRRLQADPDLRRTLERYALTGSLARGETVGLPSLHGRIGQALLEESPLDAPATPVWSSRIGRGVIGGALAAGVAAIALVTLGVGPGPESQDIAPALATVEPVSYTVPASTTNDPVIPAARLTNYLVAHGEYATMFSRKSMDSRIVAQAAPHEPDSEEAEATDETPED
jgi:hypothetical protein